jgi:hypothetical protein
MANNDDILTMPLKTLQKNIAQVQEHIASIDALLPGLAGLTPDARRHASKFRDGEAEALSSVLDAADAKPPLFESLANQDMGVDPEVFEVALLRDRLQRAVLLAALAKQFTPISDGIADTVLQLANLSKPVMLLAYDIAKTHAKLDGVIANAIRPALAFFTKIGRAAATTKKKPASGAGDAGDPKGP